MKWERERGTMFIRQASGRNVQPTPGESSKLGIIRNEGRGRGSTGGKSIERKTANRGRGGTRSDEENKILMGVIPGSKASTHKRKCDKPLTQF